MMRLLVYCYFCPSASERRGGVQQVVPALLAGLEETQGWEIAVAHSRPCSGEAHTELPELGNGIESDQVEPLSLIDCARQLRCLSTGVDVILSIDRLYPPVCDRPSVLMCNTLGYMTEAAAACLPTWAAIVVPTRHFAGLVSAVNPGVPIEVVRYGLPPSSFARAAAMAPPLWDTTDVRVQLPHRPDRRKGHVEAIEGLARARSHGRPVDLEIAWLDEPRYSSYRTELEELAARLGVADRVHFRNWFDGEARWDAVETSHAVLQLGDFEETFGLAVVEAVLCGRLALTRRQPAIREVVGSTDLFAEIDQPADWYRILAGSLDSFADGTEPARQIGRLAELTVDAMVSRYDVLLREVCSKWS